MSRPYSPIKHRAPEEIASLVIIVTKRERGGRGRGREGQQLLQCSLVVGPGRDPHQLQELRLPQAAGVWLRGDDAQQQICNVMPVETESLLQRQHRHQLHLLQEMQALLNETEIPKLDSSTDSSEQALGVTGGGLASLEVGVEVPQGLRLALACCICEDASENLVGKRVLLEMMQKLPDQLPETLLTGHFNE